MSEHKPHETRALEYNSESGSKMYMFVRNGNVTLSEANTSENGRNREDAVIHADEDDLVDVTP